MRISEVKHGKCLQPCLTHSKHSSNKSHCCWPVKTWGVESTENAPWGRALTPVDHPRSSQGRSSPPPCSPHAHLSLQWGLLNPNTLQKENEEGSRRPLKLGDGYMRVPYMNLLLHLSENFHNEKLEGHKEPFHNTWPHFVRPVLCTYDPGDALLLRTL